MKTKTKVKAATGKAGAAIREPLRWGFTRYGVRAEKQPRISSKVGVGIMITHDPLHRSGRAGLPHPAPTLGDDAQAHERIRITNLSRRKPSLNVAPHAAP